MTLDRLQIGPYVVTVHWSQDEWNRVALQDGPELLNKVGRSDGVELSIHIKPGLPPIIQADTLLHEVLHVIWYLSGGGQQLADPDDLEEHLISRHTPWLMMVIRDNPELLELLRADP